ncbi:unnamed protein product [Ambrosiozyma monospora]|uniref:Unnamed protein product n=1 Tax=Ambrosiozyma monospora TaxID=43982 RepID=A0ACB5T6M2_AMBMO|nr:unnamed protein product [Ambrosiozyma monospora]
MKCFLALFTAAVQAAPIALSIAQQQEVELSKRTSLLDLIANVTVAASHIDNYVHETDHNIGQAQDDLENNIKGTKNQLVNRLLGDLGLDGLAKQLNVTKRDAEPDSDLFGRLVTLVQGLDSIVHNADLNVTTLANNLDSNLSNTVNETANNVYSGVLGGANVTHDFNKRDANAVALADADPDLLSDLLTTVQNTGDSLLNTVMVL